jgi:hypothetical protein
MQCANSKCCCDLFDQPGGSLWLMELEVSCDELLDGDENGFPVCTLPTKYFWLCVDCSQKFVVRRWTRSGVVLSPKPERYREASYSEPLFPKPPVRLRASARIEAELTEAV